MGRKAIGVWCLGFRGLGFITFRSLGVAGLWAEETSKRGFALYAVWHWG